MCGSVRNAPWTKPRVVRHLRAVGGRRDDATTRPSARRTLDLGRLDGLVRETGRGSSGMWVAGRSSRREACRIQRHQASLPSFQGGDPAPRHLRGTGAAVPALRRGLCGALSRASVSRRIRPRRDRPLLAQEGPRPSAYAPHQPPEGWVSAAGELPSSAIWTRVSRASLLIRRGEPGFSVGCRADLPLRA